MAETVWLPLLVTRVKMCLETGVSELLHEKMEGTLPAAQNIDKDGFCMDQMRTLAGGPNGVTPFCKDSAASTSSRLDFSPVLDLFALLFFSNKATAKVVSHLYVFTFSHLFVYGRSNHYFLRANRQRWTINN